MTGQHFGKLTVLELTDTSEKQVGAFWKCQCECGNKCIVSATHLKRGFTQSCGCLSSKGEEKIGCLLRENNIPFETQKSFNNCIAIVRSARFDFYINNRYLIEYNGIQHYQATSGWNNEEHLIKTQQRDQKKIDWCKQNDVPLIIIPYTRFDKLCLEVLLLETTTFRIV